MAFEPKMRSNLPVHVNVPKNTPLYIHVVDYEPKSPKRQGSKKNFQKQLVSSPKKEPWVPPPAKTTRRTKNTITKNISLLQANADGEVKNISEELGEMEIDKDATHVLDENKENADSSYIITLNDTNIEDYELGFGDKQSVDIGNQDTESLIKEAELISHHCSSLQLFVESLQRQIPKMLFVDGDSLQDLLYNAEQCIKECAASDDLIKNVLNSTDQSAGSVMSRVPPFLNADKEHMLSKLLESYECISSILKLVLENQDKMGILALCSEQESLRKTIEIMQTNFMTREARIQELENQLSVSQAHANTLQMSKNTLEDTRSHLLQELTNKESQIERLNVQLKKFLVGSTDNKGSDHLLEVIEEIKQQSEAEKEALKKAAKFQKTRAEQNEEIISRLQRKLREKEDLVYHIANERDEWKVKLTVTTNHLTELEGQVTNLKRQYEKLQLLLDEGDTSHKGELVKLNKAMDKKSALTDQLSKQNTDLKNTLASLEERSAHTEAKLRNLQKIYDEFVNVIYPQSYEVQNENVKAEELVNVICEVKEHLMALKIINEQLKYDKEKSVQMERRKESSTNVSLLSLIEEMRQELQTVRETFQHVVDIKDRADEVSFMRKQMNDLKEKYTMAADENHKLVAKLESLERGTTSVNLFANGNGVTKVQSALREKSSEANQLYNKLVQNNEEFQKQIKGLRDQMHRQEQLNSIKILKVEDELHARRLEINSLESRHREENEKRMRKITELQDHLDEASANNQSLQKYVQFLKSSYFNVFGKV